MHEIFKPVLPVVVILVCSIGMVPLGFAKDMTFRGKVIDAETREPIEGAVVVASWLEAWQSISGEKTKLKEVKETLTDKIGEWTIVGPEGKEDDPHPWLSFFLMLSYVREPEFIIFKPGYCSWPNGFYVDACKGKLKPGGNGKIIEGENVELPRLTDREDRLRSLPGIVSGKDAQEKEREFIRLLNEESSNLGIPLYKN